MLGNTVLASTKRNELIHRLLAGRCEICESTDRIEVHHLRILADLNFHDRPGKPVWVHLMAMRRRKTLVICRPCHEDIHKGQSSARYCLYLGKNPAATRPKMAETYIDVQLSE